MAYYLRYILSYTVLKPLIENTYLEGSNFTWT